MFISCAVASKSKVIVSGDKHLLKIVSYQNIRIVTPREFIDKTITSDQRGGLQKKTSDRGTL
jgi:predicted nucleic acid-binding protein